MTGKWVPRGGLGAVVLIGITVKWSLFSSALYPYTISVPSTFAHQAVALPSGQQVDYFFASGLGSYPTNVHITATRGAHLTRDQGVFRTTGKRKAKKSSWLRVMGHNLPLIRTVHNSPIVGTWVEEGVTLFAGGYTWRLTASYEPRFKSLRSIMLRMLSSFKVR